MDGWERGRQVCVLCVHGGGNSNKMIWGSLMSLTDKWSIGERARSGIGEGISSV